jgi:hypothetical protein
MTASGAQGSGELTNYAASLISMANSALLQQPMT